MLRVEPDGSHTLGRRTLAFGRNLVARLRPCLFRLNSPDGVMWARREGRYAGDDDMPWVLPIGRA
jgi:hypothetical protein